MKWTLLTFLFLYDKLMFINCQERIAPGVPPQHYQQPHLNHGQNLHNVPQQYHQQISQVHPMQQGNHEHQIAQQISNSYQNVPIQQDIQKEEHIHQHGQSQNILNAANIINEKEHIAEHLDVPIDTSKMSEQELQFHYFKMHDADNNNKLDGCELIKSLIHWHEEGSKNPNSPTANQKIFKDEELAALIDPILEMDDINKDGFIDYPEFNQAQQKAAMSTGQH